ncbi:ATP-dependent protease La [Mycobacterium tuberculosis]|nr:ATP-dependent protease La [Mycobacterium tuberculosis]
MADFAPVELAMFPLESAPLPDEDLPLHIFEPRYAALVRDCMDTADPRFGVVLISRGREVGGGDTRCDVGTLARITECADAGSGRYMLRCRVGERIRVCDWLPDDPYPRAKVRFWPDQPGHPVTAAQLLEVEDRVVALFERIAAARGVRLPAREVVLGYPVVPQPIPGSVCTRWHVECRWARPIGTPCWRRRRRPIDWSAWVTRWTRWPRWWSSSCRRNCPTRCV